MQLAPGVASHKDKARERMVTPNKVSGPAKTEEKKSIKDAKEWVNAAGEVS